MSKLFIVPIEPLEERYTGEWRKFFPVEFAKRGFDVETIDGDQLSDVIETGSFLDINTTVHYKASQLQKIAAMFRAKKIAAGDIFFVTDIEFWGIEALRMLSQINGVPIKIFGFLHAASYTLEDAFAVAAPYQKYTELGWLALCDGVFVGSDYHRRSVIERRIAPYAHLTDQNLADRLLNTGNPLFNQAYFPKPGSGFPPREKKLVITNRFDYEKRPNESLQFAYLLKKRNPDLKVVITTSRPTFRSNQQWLCDMAIEMEKDGILKIKSGLTKTEYHNELKSSTIMLSNSIEENFGYCIAEAMVFGCVPLVPNKLSHPELLGADMRCLFDSNDEIIPKAEAILKYRPSVGYYIEKYFDEPLNKMADAFKCMGPVF